MVDTSRDAYEKEKAQYWARMEASGIRTPKKFHEYESWRKMKEYQDAHANDAPTPMPQMEYTHVNQGQQKKIPFNPFQLKYLVIGVVALVALKLLK